MGKVGCDIWEKWVGGRLGEPRRARRFQLADPMPVPLVVYPAAQLEALSRHIGDRRLSHASRLLPRVAGKVREALVPPVPHKPPLAQPLLLRLGERPLLLLLPLRKHPRAQREAILCDRALVHEPKTLKEVKVISFFVRGIRGRCAAFFSPSRDFFSRREMCVGF